MKTNDCHSVNVAGRNSFVYGIKNEKKKTEEKVGNFISRFVGPHKCNHHTNALHYNDVDKNSLCTHAMCIILYMIDWNGSETHSPMNVFRFSGPRKKKGKRNSNNKNCPKRKKKN